MNGLWVAGESSASPVKAFLPAHEEHENCAKNYGCFLLLALSCLASRLHIPIYRVTHTYAPDKPNDPTSAVPMVQFTISNVQPHASGASYGHPTPNRDSETQILTNKQQKKTHTRTYSHVTPSSSKAKKVIRPKNGYGIITGRGSGRPSPCFRHCHAAGTLARGMGVLQKVMPLEQIMGYINQLLAR